jgi:thioredoxin 2
MAPGFEQAASQLEPHVRLVKVDIQAVPSLVERFNLRSIPTSALFQGGREISREVGAMSGSEIVNWVRVNCPQARPKVNDHIPTTAASLSPR